MLWSWQRNHRKKTWQSARKSAATCSCWIGTEPNIEPKSKGAWGAMGCWFIYVDHILMLSSEAACLRLLWFAHPGRYLTAARVDHPICGVLFFVLANSQQSVSEWLEGCKLWKSQAPWIRDVGILLFVLVFILSTMNKIKDPILVGQVDSWPMAFVSIDVGRSRMGKRWEMWNKS